MKQLSVNINKIATLRNARGGNTPSVLQAAIDVQKFGAEGDHRHATSDDVVSLSELCKNRQVEFNIEGNPNPKFIELVKQIRPTQVTLVPDDR